MTALVIFAGKRNYIFKFILAVILMFQIGVGTALAEQESSKQETTTSLSDAAAPGQQGRKTPADQSVGALVDLLRKKNVISAEEVARFTEQAGSGAPGSDIVALLELLKKKNVISAEEAAGVTEQAAARGAAEKHVVIASQTNEKERIDELSQSVSQVTQKVAELYAGKVAELAAAAPEWTKRVRFGGDMRLRYENDRYDKNNALFAQPANPNQLMNTQTNQNLAKYRVRAGVTVKVDDQVEAVARLSTGNTSNPVSTNSLIGDFMNKDNVVFDLAYLKWRPADFLTAYGGRMPNPFFTTSELVWDNDLNFEGLALTAKTPVTESLTPFLTVGAFPLQQYDFASNGKWLLGGQIGLESKNRSGVAYKVGAALYDYYNMTGIANDPRDPGATDWTAPLYQQKGNTLFNISADPNVIKTAYASEFRELSLTGALDIGFWDPVHVVLLGDYVKNRGFNKADVAIRTGNPDPPKYTTGYQIGLTVGHPIIEEFGQWKAYLSYKYVGADAVVDAFTDSDFHLGGTNAKGWILGTDFGLRKNVWLRLRWMTANEISGPPLAIDVLQVDLNASF